MGTEIGEFVVGAYLRLCEMCDVVDYNARPPQPGLEGLAEVDVVGLRFADSTAFICEVATHLDGLNYGSYEATMSRIQAKYQRQQSYAKNNLAWFSKHRFMLWSPRVPIGALTTAFEFVDGLELVINAGYTERINELRRLAKLSTKDIGNPFFRTLQLLEHLR